MIQRVQSEPPVDLKWCGDYSFCIHRAESQSVLLPAPGPALQLSEYRLQGQLATKGQRYDDACYEFTERTDSSALMAAMSITPSHNLCRMPFLATLLILALLTSGCASVPYHYGKGDEYIPPVTAPEKLHIEEGRPNKFIDTLGWIFGIPSKIILWDRRVDNHEISKETRQAIADYLDSNDLDTVKVRLNQYAPGNEFSRTVHNASVGAGWKYTVGMLSWLFYTILPQRVIGGDNYNPFSNTINLYSDVSAIAVHEGAHAKDFAGRKYKGTYAAAYVFIPFFPLYSEAISSNDAISYLRADGTETEQKEGYKILYPAYGTYVGASVAPFLNSPWNILAPALGAIPGHIIGRVKASEIHQDGYNMVDTKKPE